MKQQIKAVVKKESLEKIQLKSGLGPMTARLSCTAPPTEQSRTLGVGARFSRVPETVRARKAICETQPLVLPQYLQSEQPERTQKRATGIVYPNEALGYTISQVKEIL